MSSFYVGQRVRVVRSADGMIGRSIKPILPQTPIGKVGVIVGTISRPNAGFIAVGDYDVSLRLDSGEQGMCPSACLEPATDSYEKVEWSACLWSPEHIQEDACSPNS